MPFPPDVASQVRLAGCSVSSCQTAPLASLCPTESLRPSPGLEHAHTNNHAPAAPASHSQLLEVLRGALALGNPRLAEPALSCMHKLVAYAYLQGETGPSGRLDDAENVVTQVWRWGRGANTGAPQGVGAACGASQLLSPRLWV